MEGGSDKAMIEEIHAENIALIDAVDIQPADSLTVITGETGAGKSALLASCRLLMGERAEREMIRDGEHEALVQGRFFFPKHSLSQDNPLHEHARTLENEDDIEVVISRRITSEGRSRVKIDSELASVGDLARTVGATMDLCSQHDQQKLMSQRSQRELVFAWGGADLRAMRDEYESAFLRKQAARARLDEIQELKRSSDERVEQARFVLDRIEKVDPQIDDYEELVRVLNTSENAENLKRATETSTDLLSSDDGILDRLNVCAQAIEAAVEFDPELAAHASSLREASYLIEDVARDLAQYASAIELDVSELEFYQARVAEYQALLKTYGPDVADVVERAEHERQIIEAYDNSDVLEVEAGRELESAQDALDLAADKLFAQLSELCPRFSDEVTQNMRELNMGSASFICSVSQLEAEEWTQVSPARIEFFFKPAAGMQSRPLAKIASGGELSRVMLSIHAVMGEKDDISTLVFDEIDTGVGGAVANALATLIARLSKTHQVIVVTHLAQIAAVAGKHYVVEKSEDDGIARTRISEVRDEKREIEIARMLSGSATEVSLAHARELLQSSGVS